MKKLTLSSSFESLPVTIFWYPAMKKTPHTILLLKGLYGLHDPQSTTSWDTDFIKNNNNSFNFVIINTARKNSADTQSKESFAGKTFEQECDDIKKSYQLLEKKELLPNSCILHSIANSFGGTTLLGVPELIEKTTSIVMIGSGCGKSQTTTKPLLTTMPDEDTLLHPLNAYKGVFIFIRGSNDAVVPRESQEKIIKSATSASVHIQHTVNNAQHDLSPIDEENTMMNRGKILSSVLYMLTTLTH